MDQMMSYCGQPISDDSAEACIDYSFSPKELQYSNEYDASSMNEADRDLIKQCDNYRAQIKRQEEEINSYRKHIEVIEEEYSKLSTHLSAAEKNIRQKDKQLSTFQETIGSLKNELDSFYTLERSFHEDSLTKSDISLSFSSDSNIKLFNKSGSGSESDSHSTSEVREKIQLFDSYKQMCLENVELKRQNEYFQMEVHRLKKDNTDFQDMLSNVNKPRDFINSTPIKNLNFISYQALDLDNNSFSIDEDYEVDNMLFDRNFKKSLNDVPKDLKKLVDTKNAIHLGFTVSGKDISSIENQEVPTILTNEITRIYAGTQPATTSKTESANSFLQYDVTSIEDEKFPRLNIPDLSSSDKSLKNSNEALKVISAESSQAMSIKQTSILFRQDVPLQAQTNPTSVSNSPDDSLIRQSESIASDFSLRLTMVFVAVSFVKQLKMLNLDRLFIVNSDFLWFFHSQRLLYFASLLLAIFIWKFVKTTTYPSADLQTRLVPFYSIQEIVTDIISQFFL